MDEYDSEDDLDDSCVKKKNKVKSKSKPVRSKKANDITEYMDVMDRELAHTTIGQSFVREGDNILDVSSSVDSSSSSYRPFSSKINQADEQLLPDSISICTRHHHHHL